MFVHNRWQPRQAALAVFLAFACSACSPNGPTPTPPPQPPPPPGPQAAMYTLYGTVLHRDGSTLRPASGVSVELSPTKRSTTDADGRYALENVASGTYTLRASSSFYEPVSVTVRVDDHMSVDLEVVALPLYMLSGQVYEVIDGVDVPIAGVHVENSELHWASLTDATGFYQVGAHRGEVPLYVNKPGYRDGSTRVSMTGDTQLNIRLVRQ